MGATAHRTVTNAFRRRRRGRACPVPCRRNHLCNADEGAVRIRDAFTTERKVSVSGRTRRRRPDSRLDRGGRLSGQSHHSAGVADARLPGQRPSMKSRGRDEGYRYLNRLRPGAGPFDKRTQIRGNSCLFAGTGSYPAPVKGCCIGQVTRRGAQSYLHALSEKDASRAGWGCQ